VELLPSDGVQTAQPETAKYTVTVHTSDIKGAGTDATVLVELAAGAYTLSVFSST
jgi:hypothetical protein